MAPITRRQLVHGSAAAAAAAGLTSLKTVRRTRPGSPSEELRVAVVGLNGQGGSHINGFQSLPGVDVVALVDVDSHVLARRKAELEKKKAERDGWQGGAVAAFKDLRVALEREDIDVISIATPNHLHALLTIWACQAGKDVYVEKPVCHNIFEGRQMVRAARAHGRIVQTGTQSRTSQGIAEGIAWMHEGNLGEIRLAHATCYKPRKSIGKVSEPTPIPDHVDWDLYCGPAPKGPLMRKRLHYDWHWQFITGNGDLGNQGIHQMDTARWALGIDELAQGVACIGGRFGYDDDGDTPNTMATLLAYEPAPLLFEVRGLPRDERAQAENWGGSMDRIQSGSIGTTILCDGGYLVIPNSNDRAIAYDNESVEIRRWQASSSHFANLVEAVRARDASKLTADILEGHLSSSLCHMGNIAYLCGKRMVPDAIQEAIGSHKVGSESFDRMADHLDKNGVDLEQDMVTLCPMLPFDPKNERFVDDEGANALITRDYRAPFVVPSEV